MTGTTIEYLLTDVSVMRRAQADHSWLDSLLSSAEIAHSNRLRNASDRTAYRCAHILLRLVAARRLKLEPDTAGDLQFTRTCRSCGGPHGKPRIAGAELSLSRSRNMVFIASAPPSTPIGVDVEFVPTEVFAGFDSYALAPTEPVPHGPDSVRRRLEVWVSKEAAVKATGQGLAVAPSDLEVVRPGVEASAVPTASQWTAAIRAPGQPELNRLNLAPVPSPPAYVAALSCADTPYVAPIQLPELLSPAEERDGAGKVGQAFLKRRTRGRG